MSAAPAPGLLRRLRRLCAAALAACALAGCGQMGPLEPPPSAASGG